MSKQEKKKQFQQHLQQQNKLREHQMRDKKQMLQQQKNLEEDMLFIQKQFRTKSQEIQQLLLAYKKKEITFTLVHEKYLALKQYYVSINYALKTYDRQIYKQAIQKQYNHMIDLKNRFQPRKKFKFSRRDQDFGVKKVQVEDQKVIKAQHHINVPGISDLQSQIMQINEDSQIIGSYKIVDSTDCQIDLLHKTQILFLKRLKNCKIRAAITKSTVFVDQCQGCTFQLSCHQLRIHNTTSTTFGIFVTSKAIIEDCTKVLFKPYSFQYERRGADEVAFGRTGKENLWREIQDFNWLKEGQKSPNFDLIQQ